MKKLFVFLALVMISLSGLLLFALEQKMFGYGALLLSLLAANYASVQMLKDISLVAIGVFIVSLVPVTTDISVGHMVQMGLAMTAAVAIPYLISRFVYKDHLIRFPFGFKEPWNRAKWLYILLVLVIGFFIMPLYLIGTGMYTNWPAANDASSIIRLFVGTNALGTWDELFFICVVFVVFSRYASFWVANLLQAVLFTSFLFELGFEGVGPFMIYLFALTQGYIFNKTHSVFYLLCVHLLFDFIMFLGCFSFF